MNVFSNSDVAMDIGTATIRVASHRRGVCRQPSVFRGLQALRRGVIVDMDATTELLRPLMQTRRRVGLPRPRVLACAPTDVTSLERHSIQTCILEAGAASVVVLPEPLAAAVGSGIDIGCKYAKFIVDFGEGVTDCAIIRQGRIVASLAERVGCSDLRRAVQATVAKWSGDEVSEAEADRLMREIGLGRLGKEVFCWDIAGRPIAEPLSMSTFHEELRPVIDRLLAPIKGLLRDIPASIGAEVIEDGIFLTGGGALLPGMCAAVAEASAIVARTVAEPLNAVIDGAQVMLPLAGRLNLWKTRGRHRRTGASSPADFTFGD